MLDVHLYKIIIVKICILTPGFFLGLMLVKPNVSDSRVAVSLMVPKDQVFSNGI